jgi:hypothetical protein
MQRNYNGCTGPAWREQFHFIVPKKFFPLSLKAGLPLQWCAAVLTWRRRKALGFDFLHVLQGSQGNGTWYACRTDVTGLQGCRLAAQLLRLSDLWKEDKCESLVFEVVNRQGLLDPKQADPPTASIIVVWCDVPEWPDAPPASRPLLRLKLHCLPESIPIKVGSVLLSALLRYFGKSILNAAWMQPGKHTDTRKTGWKVIKYSSLFRVGAVNSAYFSNILAPPSCPPRFWMNLMRRF